MDKQMKDIFCRQIDTELERISKLPSLDNNTLSQLHMLTDTKKNLLKIEKLEMENNPMMEGNSYRMMGNSYAQNNGNGYSNGYAMNGPYYGGSYDNGYSRADGRSHLEAAMRDARNEQEREEIRQLMSRYHN
jgi:hypothetical protein